MRTKTKIIAAAVILLVAALAALFISQSTPGNVLNLARAEALKPVNGVLTIPEKYTVIEAEAVAGKTDFHSLVIKGEAEICYHAFYGCPSLESVVLEKTCDIGEGAFAACPMLKSVTVLSSDGRCTADAVSGHGGLTLFCRDGSDAYNAALAADISVSIID